MKNTEEPSVLSRFFGVLLLVLLCAGLVVGAALYGSSMYGQTAPQWTGTQQGTNT